MNWIIDHRVYAVLILVSFIIYIVG